MKKTFVIDIDFEIILEKTGFCNKGLYTTKIKKTQVLWFFVKYNHSNSRQKQNFIEKMTAWLNFPL